MIDFNATALLAGMNAFAVPVTFTPTKSQPNAAAYSGRGVWDAKPTTIYVEGQAPVQTTTLSLGIRLSEFSVPPTQGDTISINGNSYTLDTPQYDGQGGVTWMVKADAAGQETPV